MSAVDPRGAMLSSPENRPGRARSAALFAVAARRYWLQVFPAARSCQRRLRGQAHSIPDPVLREDALISHHHKAANSEGLAALAILAPREHRPSVACTLAAYQLLLDYLDGVSERRSEDPVA